MSNLKRIPLDQVNLTPDNAPVPIDTYISQETRQLLADCHPTDYAAAFGETLLLAIAEGDADPFAATIPAAYMAILRYNVWKYSQQRRAYENRVKGN